MKTAIITSIAPKNIDNQIHAIKSWHNISDDIISVNTSEEIKILSDHIKDITFVVASGCMTNSLGSHYIYLDNILSEFKNRNVKTCIILNSDILLTSDKNIIQYVARESHDSLVYGSRIEVLDFDHLEGKEYFGGFDFFVFDANLIDDFLGTTFCLGLPWWDYWLPFVSIAKKHETKRLTTPFVYHKSHAVNWSIDFYTHYGTLLVDYISHKCGNELLWADMADCIKLMRNSKDFTPLNAMMLLFLRMNSKLIWYDDFNINYSNNEAEYLYRLNYKDSLKLHPIRSLLARLPVKIRKLIRYKTPDQPK